MGPRQVFAAFFALYSKSVGLSREKYRVSVFCLGKAGSFIIHSRVEDIAPLP